MYKRKTTDEWLIQGYCSGILETVNTEMTQRDAKRSIREYRENEPYTLFQIKKVRIKNG